MVDDRNLTSHTYNEDIAEYLFKKLEVYAKLMRVAVEKLKRNLV
ncbi:MAG: nucleotidyltransferase substrate binding protein [Hydrogenobacter thermophilus]|nr:nucleotidyltransferase substrate binding protein [Hydrogenobacter thermophilus]